MTSSLHCFITKNGVCHPFFIALFILLNSQLYFGGQVRGQMSISAIHPSTVQPGVTSKLTLRGANLSNGMSVRTVRQDVKLELENITPESAILSVSHPGITSFEPIPIWVGAAGALIVPRYILLDDLPVVMDNGANHSLATAQSIANLQAVDGISDGPALDYYRITVSAGQRLSFQVLTQSIHSKMDPVLRILKADGSLMKLKDDSSVGPDPHFSHVFPEAGEYFVEVSDSHYGPGTEYHLRVGDFPVFDHLFPMAVQRGQPTSVEFVGSELASEIRSEVLVPDSWAATSFTTSIRANAGSSSAWGELLVTSFPQYLESPTEKKVLELPMGLSGKLTAANEVDTHWIRCIKGQPIRFSSQTRSLGSGALLQMQLLNAAGGKLSETAVSAMDEWSFDFTPPEDGEYRLVVNDLLQRGGPGYGYYIQAERAGSFTLQLKPDPNTRQRFAFEETHGGGAIELQVNRFGYEGEIQLNLIPNDLPIRLINPRIPAGAKDHRCIMVCQPGWMAQAMNLVRLSAEAVSDPVIRAELASDALSRVLEPHVLVPSRNSSGVVALAGNAASQPLFGFEVPVGVQWNRASDSHVVSFPLKRLKEDFKAAVVVDGSLLPNGWTLSSTADKDIFTVSVKRVAGQEPAAITFFAYTDLPDRVRCETVSIPISWIDVPQRLEVYPPTIDLEGANSKQQLVVTGYDSQGNLKDWSNAVNISSANPGVVKVEKNLASPTGNGETELIFQIADLKLSVPVKVKQFEYLRPMTFENDVLVALSKQGCNSGACHGSPSGKGGFRLSLRAFDKELDELTLIHEDFGRRVNVLDPDHSLLIEKPLMKVSHAGGKQLNQHDVAYKVLRDWIAQGAKGNSSDESRCSKLEVFPAQKRMLQRRDGPQQLAATAHFADGKKRDVSEVVAYESSNTEVATVNKHGLVTPLKRGETVILVRYLEHIESIPLMFIDDVPGFQWVEPASANYIDVLVNQKLKQLQFLPGSVCDDATFLRRVTLDVIGLLPTSQETIDFLADTSSDKRARLIDRLLERDEYAKFWALKWGDLLKLTSKSIGNEGVFKFYRWVENAMRSNMPYDRFASELIAGSGSTLENPPANFYRSATDMNECVETVSQVFLGARLQCAKCHNHPFERWTQDNYYGLGAFFNRLQRKTTQRPGEMFIWAASSGEVTQPRTLKQMKPWLPGVGSLESETQGDRRQSLVQWLVAPANPYFAKIEVNRIWSHLFARGIVDPVDDFRDSNPPSNEPLLVALAEDFANHQFDRKHLMRAILNSNTYQCSSEALSSNAEDQIYFSHQAPRMLSAEQLMDAINQTLDVEQSFAGLPASTKATHLPAPDVVKVGFLKVFGQPERSTVCACERSEDTNLGMAIELFNGPFVAERLKNPNNRFRKLMSEGKTAEEVIKAMYTAAYSRSPSDNELKIALEFCQSKPDLAACLEDICWAMLNSDEFLFQH